MEFIFLLKFSHAPTDLKIGTRFLNLRFLLYFRVFVNFLFQTLEFPFRKAFNFFASPPSIDRFPRSEGAQCRLASRTSKDLIVPIIQNERGHSQEPSLLSYDVDVHKRDLRYRKISFDRFEISFQWRDSPGNQLSWRARYLLITPEIRRVDKEFEWMGRIKSFFLFFFLFLFFRSTSFILLANILVFRLSYYFANTR